MEKWKFWCFAKIICTGTGWKRCRGGKTKHSRNIPVLFRERAGPQEIDLPRPSGRHITVRGSSCETLHADTPPLRWAVLALLPDLIKLESPMRCFLEREASHCEFPR